MSGSVTPPSSSAGASDFSGTLALLQPSGAWEDFHMVSACVTSTPLCVVTPNSRCGVVPLLSPPHGGRLVLGKPQVVRRNTVSYFSSEAVRTVAHALDSAARVGVYGSLVAYLPARSQPVRVFVVAWPRTWSPSVYSPCWYVLHSYCTNRFWL